MKAIDDGVKEIQCLYCNLPYLPPEAKVKSVLKRIIQAAIKEVFDAESTPGTKDAL